MKIKRTVNGQEMEFKLTHSEMCSAFGEYQKLIDIEDVDLYILDELIHDPDYCMETFGVDVRLLEKHIDDIAYKFREDYEYRIDDDAKCDAVYAAVKQIAEDIRERGETYED